MPAPEREWNPALVRLALTLAALVAGCHHGALVPGADGGSLDAASANQDGERAPSEGGLPGGSSPMDVAADPGEVDAAPDAGGAPLPVDAAPDTARLAPPPDAGLDAGVGCQTGCRPTAEWVRILTAQSDIQVTASNTALVGGSAGELYMTAQFRRDAVLAGQPIVNTSQPIDHVDSLVAAFDPSGTLRWFQLAGGPWDQSITSLALDRGGQVYLTVSSIDGPASVAGKPTLDGDAFASLGAADGEALWLESPAAGSDTRPEVIAVDPAGNLYLGGRYRQLVQFGDQKLTGDSSGKQFLASFTPDRKVRWLKDLGVCGDLSIAVRGIDDIILAGRFVQLRLGGQIWQTKSLTDAFITALGPDATPRWTTVFPAVSTSTNAFIYGLGVDATGAVFANGNMGNGTGVNVMVVALSEAGALRWNLTSKDLGGPTPDGGAALAVGADGGVYFAAHFGAPVTLGGQRFPHPDDTYLVRFDGDGRIRWAMDFGGTPSYPAALAPLPGGRLGLLGQIRKAGTVLGLPLRPDGAEVPAALYVLSLKQP